MPARPRRLPIPAWLIPILTLAVTSCDGCFPEVSCDIDASGLVGSGGGDGTGGDDAFCQACGGDCCVGDETCFNGACVSPDSDCFGPSDCDPESICDFTGSPPLVALPLGTPASCDEPVVGQCLPAPAPASDCTLPAASDPLQLSVTRSWGDPAMPDAADSVVTTPAVIPLNDDNCDGLVDGFDRPELVFMTASESGATSHGRLHAYQASDDALEPVWTAPAGSPPNDPTTHLATARSSDEALIAVCTQDDRVRAYDGAGLERWVGPPSLACDSVVIADLDEDGLPEVVTESQILDGLTGEEVASYGPAPSHGFVVSNVGAALPRIVTSSRAYDEQGAVVVDASLPDGFVAMLGTTAVAIDPVAAELHLWRIDEQQAVVDTTVDLNAPFAGSCPAGTLSGGPPAVAPDGSAIGVATALGVLLLNEDGDVLWVNDDVSCGEGTRAVSLYDLDGDTQPEVLGYRGDRLRVHAGSDGSLVASPCNVVEGGFALPIVVDVDANGFGEVVSAASARFGATCDSQPTTGVFVRDLAAPVTRTRAVHTQFAYRPLLVDDDGTLSEPVFYAAGGTRTNPSTRQTPRFAIYNPDGCDEQSLMVRVVNTGSAPIAARSAAVQFHEPVSGFTARTVIPVTLAPGANVNVELPQPPSGDLDIMITGSDDGPLVTCAAAPASLAVTCP